MVRRRDILHLALVPLVAACATTDQPALSEQHNDDVESSPAPDPKRIAYGSDPSQFGDLYLPAGTPRGVAVVIHGGFWRSQYGLEYGAPLAASVQQRGWAAWNIEYRRVGNGGGVPATLDDVAAAIAHLDALDLPTGPVVGIGHSAGGHLVTWAGAGGRLTHVISQAGVLDLVAAAEEHLGGGAVQAFVGSADPTPADLAPIDPLQMLPLDVPVWCVHATGDDIVPISQSRTYVDAARAAGARAELIEVDGDHFAVIDPDSDAWARTLAVLDALG